MLGFAPADVAGKLSMADLFSPDDIMLRAKKLSIEFSSAIAPGFDAIVHKAARGLEDVFETCYVCKDGSLFPVVASVTALRDAQDAIIGYLLISTDIGVRRYSEYALHSAGTLKDAIFNSADVALIATDEHGVIQLFNLGAQHLRLRC
jgi:PAS domain-containing protein